jgi:L-threonylcarbamoyladenylate synthase
MPPVPVNRPSLPTLAPVDWPAGTDRPAAATAAAIATAAELLASGRLVAIPTETVYGLAAKALDPEAVALIFRAKGRPASNPLIVHVADTAMARRLAADWPEAAERATAACWPGPLTVVVNKAPEVPDIVTAGGPTVALRCPALHLTRRLIEQAGCPLAAPSANRSEAVSPTTAQHVLEGLGNRVSLILDAGPCEHGLESTVLDCTVVPPRILRPGPLSADQLASAIGGEVAPAAQPVNSSPDDQAGEPGRVGQEAEAAARSPGQRRRHYAPRTPLEVVPMATATERVADRLAAGERVGWLCLSSADAAVRRLAASPALLVVPMPEEPAAYGRMLYASLHALDHRELDRLVVDAVPDGSAWAAIADRLSRAQCTAGR